MKQISFLTVFRVGSSNAVVIPASYCRALGIGRGDQMRLAVDTDETIRLRRLSKEEREKIIRF